MKTFKTFIEQLVPVYKMGRDDMGRNVYPKNTPFIIDKNIKNNAKEVFKFKSGIDLAKKKSNKNIKTA